MIYKESVSESKGDMPIHDSDYTVEDVDAYAATPSSYPRTAMYSVSSSDNAMTNVYVLQLNSIMSGILTS